MNAHRAIVFALLLLGAVLSQACYVQQDLNGEWWACEDHQTANGPLTACTPIAAPF